MVDADMIIFAEDEKTYQKYSSAIQKEYQHLKPTAYFSRRLDFLMKLQNYKSSHGKLFFNLYPLHEEQASKNIANEILELEYQLCNLRTRHSKDFDNERVEDE
jgi:predicted metal-dependent HD superfamily phosphohydrolase